MEKIIVNTDGGARGNPGPAGIGVVIADDKGAVVARFSQYIGEATNNVAEYKALIYALEKLKNFDYTEAECRLDSELIVRQLNGEYRVKEGKLKELYQQVQQLIFFKPIKFVHVPREKNKEAGKNAAEPSVRYFHWLSFAVH